MPAKVKSTEKPPKVTLLTGPRGVGKTTWILELSKRLQARGTPFFGVATPKIVKDGKVVGIDVRDLATGEEVALAFLDDVPGVRVGPWRFFPEGTRFANAACDADSHEGVALLDEIGPLELRGEGFLTAFESLKKGRYSRAVVVARPELVDELSALFAGSIQVLRWEDAQKAPLWLP